MLIRLIFLALMLSTPSCFFQDRSIYLTNLGRERVSSKYKEDKIDGNGEEQNDVVTKPTKGKDTQVAIVEEPDGDSKETPSAQENPASTEESVVAEQPTTDVAEPSQDKPVVAEIKEKRTTENVDFPLLALSSHSKTTFKVNPLKNVLVVEAQPSTDMLILKAPADGKLEDQGHGIFKFSFSSSTITLTFNPVETELDVTLETPVSAGDQLAKMKGPVGVTLYKDGKAVPVCLQNTENGGVQVDYLFNTEGKDSLPPYCI